MRNLSDRFEHNFKKVKLTSQFISNNGRKVMIWNQKFLIVLVIIRFRAEKGKCNGKRHCPRTMIKTFPLKNLGTDIQILSRDKPGTGIPLSSPCQEHYCIFSNGALLAWYRVFLLWSESTAMSICSYNRLKGDRNIFHCFKIPCRALVSVTVREVLSARGHAK